MRSLLGQLLDHDSVPAALKDAARRAIDEQDDRKILSVGRSIIDMLRDRGELVKVRLHGAANGRTALYAFKGHSGVLDLEPFMTAPRAESPPSPRSIRPNSTPCR